MKKVLRNSEMAEMLRQLKPFLSQRNRLGYVIARNYRILSDALTEYDRFKMELIKKHGEPDKAEDGSELDTISIKIGSPAFKLFCDEIAPINNMEQEIDIMVAKYEDVIGILSGEEILGIDWMLED